MKTLYSMLERLSELFPKQDYHIRMEKYLNSQNPTSISEVENYTREFMRNNNTGI
jgi:hypothetical protein